MFLFHMAITGGGTPMNHSICATLAQRNAAVVAQAEQEGIPTRTIRGRYGDIVVKQGEIVPFGWRFLGMTR